MTAPANLRGWGQGWPVNRSKDMLTVRTARSNVPFTVHRDIAPIVKWLVDEVERRGYSIHTPGQTPDDWSYANRAIRGRNAPSNHSWGLAIDIDATQYPLGSRKRHPSWMVELFRAHGFDYGGNWTKRPDPMHYEFNGWPSDARRIREQILRYPTAGAPSTPPSAAQPAPTPTPTYRVPEDDMDKIIKRAGKDQFWFRESNGKTAWITKAQAEAIRTSYLRSNAPCPLVELPDNGIKELGMVLPK